MATNLPFMNCQNKRLINGAPAEAARDYIIASQMQSGWVPPPSASDNVAETWTYASATTVTVTTDATTRYQKGMKARLKQGGGYKYFYIINVTATVLTLFAGSDYTVANSAITNIEVSSAEVPFGFPDYFNWLVTISAGGTMGISSPVINVARFTIKGKVCFFYINASCTTVTPAHSDIIFNFPVVNATNNAGGACRISNTGSGTFGSWLSSNGNCVVRIDGEGNWGLGTLRRFIITGHIEF